MVLRTKSLADRFQSLDANLRPAFARRLARFFSGQARRVLARYLALYASTEAVVVQPQPEELLPDEERQRLWLTMLPFLYAALTESSNLAGDLVGLTELVESDPRIAPLLSEANVRTGWMHRTTLDAIRTTLADGAARGYTVGQIAHGVPDDSFRSLRIVVEVYSGRAQTIAATETTYMRQVAAIERYQEAGIAEVRVSDGTEPTVCGWERHNDPDRADGSRRTIWAARAFPLAHPNCRRVFTPIRQR